jgi:ABC-2 type transport system ATP-binding protein
MDLKQRKLNRSEWNSIEITVSSQEMDVLNMIMDGYNDVNIRINKTNSIFTFLKIEYSEKMEDFVYNKYLKNRGELIENELKIFDVLYKKMKIGEQALYLAQLKGLSKADAMAKIKEWFIKFEMQSWYNKKVEDLSKGMSQKLQFVTTVLHNPELIILDEPFSGLDPVNANLIKDEIYKLAKSGSTIIFSTHRMEQVEEICDHIILVNKGSKILDGTVKQIRQDFKEDLFAIEFDNLLLPEHAGTHLFQVVNKIDHKIIIKRNEGYSNNDIIEYFIKQGLEISSFNEILPSLNDIFIRLVESTPSARQFQTV